MNKPTPRFHGLLTLGLLLAAFLTGFIGIAVKAVLPAVFYALVVVVGLPVIVFLFCGKCACRGGRCLMVYPGRLSLRLPDRSGDAYTAADLAGVLGTLVLLAVFPLYWLWQTWPLFVLYAVLGMAAHAEILLFVCKSCENCRCPVNGWFRARG